MSNSGVVIFISLIVESDSEVAVLWIWNKETGPWSLWEIFSAIDTFYDQLGGVDFANIYRKSNHLADFLAKSGAYKISIPVYTLAYFCC